VYAGVGTAAKRPFQDLNMMQDPIPVVLLRAEQDPYSVKGLTSCDVLMNRVAELDLALGPDLDAPVDRPKSKMTEDAGLAAAAALEAAAAAAEGFMPVRSVVKRVSGASKYEKHVKHSILAGTERRTFLKAIGVMHNCGWPAAPLTVSAEDAKIVTAWGPASLASPLNMVVQVNAPAPQSATVQGAVIQAPAQAGVSSPPTVQATVAVQAAGPVPATPVARAPAPTLSAPMVQTAALAPSRPASMANVSGAPTQTTPQAVAQPAALVSTQTGSPAPASPGAYSPAPGSAPWTSTPPGSR
jgi:hypothetical protein